MKIRTLLALALLLMPSLMFALQKQERLYVYGVATSFNDSTVYITEIQQLDSAWVDTKTGFLYSRNNYSFQLRDHLKANGFATPHLRNLLRKDTQGDREEIRGYKEALRNKRTLQREIRHKARLYIQLSRTRR